MYYCVFNRLEGRDQLLAYIGRDYDTSNPVIQVETAHSPSFLEHLLWNMALRFLSSISRKDVVQYDGSL